MSDGGDGFGAVMAELLGARGQNLQTVDAAHRPITAQWWWAPQTRTAIIESAQVIGLAQLPRGQYHPFELDTYGLGDLFRAVAKWRPSRCLIGIGGSATNDGGFGMARALGWDFLNREKKPIAAWTDLASLDCVRSPTEPLDLGELQVAVDVQNPLLGSVGASRVYGPQKGLQEHQFAQAELCLGTLADVLMRKTGVNAAVEPGTGAAGGLGFGLRVFMQARLEPGFELFSQRARLGERIAAADLVITGEGAIDRSTLMGKGVGELALLCRKLSVPCLGLAGSFSPGEPEQQNYGPFQSIWGIVPELASLAAALADAEGWLEKLATQAALARDSQPPGSRGR
jgi:glycerate kinase